MSRLPKDPNRSKEHAREIRRGINAICNPQDYKCSICNEPCNPDSPDWIWDGDDWVHMIHPVHQS